MINTATTVEFRTQAQYDLWLATKPDFSRITHFWADNLPLVTAMPDMPNATYFRADKHLTALRKVKKAGVE